MSKVGALVHVHQTHAERDENGKRSLRLATITGLVTAVDEEAGTVDVFVPSPTYSGIPVLDGLDDDHEGFAAVPVDVDDDGLGDEVAELGEHVAQLAARLAVLERAALAASEPVVPAND